MGRDNEPTIIGNDIKLIGSALVVVVYPVITSLPVVVPLFRCHSGTTSPGLPRSVGA